MAHITDSRRFVELKSGEAFFKIAEDKERPFTVQAGDISIEAIGTAFNVQYVGDTAKIVVTNGVVVVGSKAGLIEGIATTETDDPITSNFGYNRLKAGRIILTLGEELEFRRGDLKPVLKTADLRSVAAWRINQLVFERDDLFSIIREFNRYNKVRIVVRDRTLMSQRFSGVFAADDPYSFIRFLELTAQVKISRVGNDIIINPR